MGALIPAKAGIQDSFEPEPNANLDVGVHRRNEPLLRLKPALSITAEGACDFNHPPSEALTDDPI